MSGLLTLLILGGLLALFGVCAEEWDRFIRWQNSQPECRRERCLLDECTDPTCFTEPAANVCDDAACDACAMGRVRWAQQQAERADEAVTAWSVER